LNRESGAFTDRAHPQAQRVAAIGFEWGLRIDARLDQGAAQRQSWRMTASGDAVGLGLVRADDGGAKGSQASRSPCQGAMTLQWDVLVSSFRVDPPPKQITASGPVRTIRARPEAAFRSDIHDRARASCQRRLLPTVMPIRFALS
jgi:hypothetical protein